jgi:hypothetical protein
MITGNDKRTTLGLSLFNGVSLGFIGSAACSIRPPRAEMPGAFPYYAARLQAWAYGAPVPYSI